MHSIWWNKHFWCAECFVVLLNWIFFFCHYGQGSLSLTAMLHPSVSQKTLYIKYRNKKKQFQPSLKVIPAINSLLMWWAFKKCFSNLSTLYYTLQREMGKNWPCILKCQNIFVFIFKSLNLVFHTPCQTWLITARKQGALIQSDLEVLLYMIGGYTMSVLFVCTCVCELWAFVQLLFQYANFYLSCNFCFSYHCL